MLPNPDTLEEFTVQSANYSARTAGAGALVELATRSGTNQFHASAFEFLRDTSLNANDFFANKAGRDKPPFKLNQYGGTAGGSIIQSKTFFFGAYQGTKRRSSPGINSIRSLTAAERAGNFSDTTTVIRDPLTGQPFPGNIIPANRIDPMVTQILNDMLPLPNSGLNLVFPNQQDLDDDQVTARHRPPVLVAQPPDVPVLLRRQPLPAAVQRASRVLRRRTTSATRACCSATRTSSAPPSC